MLSDDDEIRSDDSGGGGGGLNGSNTGSCVCADTSGSYSADGGVEGGEYVIVGACGGGGLDDDVSDDSKYGRWDVGDNTIAGLTGCDDPC